MAAGADARQPSAVQHPSRKGLVTVAGKPGDDLAPGTLNSILKQAGVRK
jgi:predicted RNA binding protein YcfA (HicA-like mRNA interferase family)